jgi:hypothetical protein
VCQVVSVFQSRRRANAYKDIGTGTLFGFKYFTIKWENGKARLLVDMWALNSQYDDLSTSILSGPGKGKQPRWGRKKSGTAAAAAAAAATASANDVLYHDTDEGDQFSPYWPGLTPVQIRREERRAVKAFRQDQRLQRREQRDIRRYDNWVRKQLGVKNGQSSVMTPEQYDMYYLRPTNKHFPWKWATDESGTFSDAQAAANRQGSVAAAAQDTGGGGGGGGGGSDDDEVEKLNYGGCSRSIAI